MFAHEGRHYIVDWKSNWLGERSDDYGPTEIAQAMRQHRYDVQLCIYAAALKRMLAWREPATEWPAAFGGVFYLFLRGMGPGSANGIHFARPGDDEIDVYLDWVDK